jgi:hypothetical protein
MSQVVRVIPLPTFSAQNLNKKNPHEIQKNLMEEFQLIHRTPFALGGRT